MNDPKEAEKLVAEALRKLGTPDGNGMAELKFKDIVTLTTPEIEWGANPSNLMAKVLELGGAIVKTRYAHYGIPNGIFYGRSEDVELERQEAGIEAHEEPAEGDNAGSGEESPSEPPRASEHDALITPESERLLSDFRRTTAHQPMQKAKKDYKFTAQHYKRGDFIEGIITGIIPTGIFITDDRGIAGLVHRSEVRDGDFIPEFRDLERMFKMGDQARAKVLSVRHNDGRLQLSMKGMKLNKKEEAAPEEIERFVESERPFTNSLAAAMTKALTAPEQETKIPEAIQEPIEEANEEMAAEKTQIEQVEGVVNSIVGMISEEAKAKIVELVAEHGIIAFSMAMGQVIPNFKVDVSMQFVQEIDKRARDGLRRS